MMGRAGSSSKACGGDRGAVMTTISRLATALSLCLGFGCAEGFEFSQAAEQLADQPGVVSIGGGGTSAPTSDAGPADPGSTFTGTACEMGQTMDCVCANGGMGTQNCRYDANSPTNGSLSECSSCSEPPPMSMPDASTPGDVMAAGASGTSSGAGGLSGGSGVMATTGGSGGSTGGAPPPPPPPPASTATCNPPCTQVCFPVGILPCCAPGGRCGCTWAPGAYCL
jgi:hypothetical protein